MSEIIREHILQHLAEGSRLDGRSSQDYREISIERGVSVTAEGSARVRIGNTEVIAGVKLGVEKPYSDTPEQGNLMVNAELLPLSSSTFEPGPPSIFAIELARVTDRGIRESGMVDLKKLCIERGEKVWTIQVDVCTVNHDGNLFDAANLAALAALQDTRFPTVTEDGVDYKNRTDEHLVLDGLAVSTTVYKIGNHVVVDPTLQEEQSADARLTINALDENQLCAMQKGGAQSFTLEQVRDMVDLAMTSIKRNREILLS